jgi:hypothetical protein
VLLPFRAALLRAALVEILRSQSAKVTLALVALCRLLLAKPLLPPLHLAAL